MSKPLFLNMGQIVVNNHRFGLRKRAAREAAELLYTGQEKEYKQAKLSAAKTLGIHFLPSNTEIAIELNRIAEGREGPARQENLVKMRRKALQIMEALKNFNPLLVGSVWRGTTHHNSDIDIITYAQNPRQIISTLHRKNLVIAETEVQTVTKKGERKRSFHIYVELPTRKAEIIVRNPQEINRQVKCEIYGDLITGLTLRQLQQVLNENPQQKFLPLKNAEWPVR